MINLHTKFEVSMFTHYKDMKGNTKGTNWVVWRLRVTWGYRHVTIQYRTYNFLFNVNITMWLSCTIFELRVICQKSPILT